MLFLMMGFICLFYESKFMLISGGHISNRSIGLDFSDGKEQSVEFYYFNTKSGQNCQVTRTLLSI